MKELVCAECGESYDWDEVDHHCFYCGNQIKFTIGPSLGSHIEILGRQLLDAESDKDRDFFFALLHFVGCELIDRADLLQLEKGYLPENIKENLIVAIENSQEIDGENMLNCPMCSENISAWAKSFSIEDDTERREFDDEDTLI
jgi:hypothetical protein